MALTGGTVQEVQVGGSDSLNSGGYDTATTGKLTDLTTTASTGNTSAPVLKSASYNFVAADVGNWVHIATSGGASGWIAGWYKVSSVNSNQATVDASVGAAILSTFVVNTTAGVSTAATPTTGTFSVDYSQKAAVVFSLTGLTTAAANAIILSASATKAMVGNLIQITGGTNFTAGFYVIQACTAGVSLTVDRNCTTAAGAAGTAGIGGALASVGQALTNHVGSSGIFVQQGTYSVGASTTALLTASWIQGYATLRGDHPTGSTRPLLQATAGSITVLSGSSNLRIFIGYLSVDGNSQTSVTAFAFTGGSRSRVLWCKALGCATGFSFASGGNQTLLCEANTCTTGFTGVTLPFGCYAKGGTTGFTSLSAPQFCIADGATTGFTLGTGANPTNCVAYNGTTGFSAADSVSLTNCLASTCTTGFSLTSNSDNVLYNCAGFNNTTNVSTLTAFNINTGFVSLSADPFLSASTGNFGLTAAAIVLLAGVPGTLPGTMTLGYLFQGAAQPQLLGGSFAFVG